MAQGLEEVLGERLTDGVVTVKYGHLAPVSRVTIHEAAHPVPDAAGMRAAEALRHLAQQAGGDDVVFVSSLGRFSCYQRRALASPLRKSSR